MIKIKCNAESELTIEEQDKCFVLSIGAIKKEGNGTRKYKAGDLVEICGFHGRLFGDGIERFLDEPRKLGTKTCLISNETPGGDVRIEDGVLRNGGNLLSICCIKLVQPVEEIGTNGAIL
jgi:hypothetical protein